MSINTVDVSNVPVCCENDCCNEAYLYQVTTKAAGKPLSLTRLGQLWNAIDGQRHCLQGTQYFFSLFGTTDNRMQNIFREALDLAIQDHDASRVQTLVTHEQFAHADIGILEEAYHAASEENYDDIIDVLINSSRGAEISQHVQAIHAASLAEPPPPNLRNRYYHTRLR